MKVWVTRDRIDIERCCGIFESKKKPCLNNSGAYPVSNGDLTSSSLLSDISSCQTRDPASNTS